MHQNCKTHLTHNLLNHKEEGELFENSVRPEGPSKEGRADSRWRAAAQSNCAVWAIELSNDGQRGARRDREGHHERHEVGALRKSGATDDQSRSTAPKKSGEAR